MHYGVCWFDLDSNCSSLVSQDFLIRSAGDCTDSLSRDQDEMTIIGQATATGYLDPGMSSSSWNHGVQTIDIQHGPILIGSRLRPHEASHNSFSRSQGEI